MKNVVLALILLKVVIGLTLTQQTFPGESANLACQDANRGITFDFECGCLYGWTSEGDAFKNQPTLGDNPTARNRGLPSKHEGNYWIGGYENYTSTAGTPGTVAGDQPTGTLTSKPFRIYSNSISFLISGGNLQGIRLELVDYATGSVLLSTSGNNSETLERKSWDVTSYYQKYAFIRAVDEEKGDWGHLNFDDIKFVN